MLRLRIDIYCRNQKSLCRDLRKAAAFKCCLIVHYKMAYSVSAFKWQKLYAHAVLVKRQGKTLAQSFTCLSEKLGGREEQEAV